MRVACFCGCSFEASGESARCPHCGELTRLPSVSLHDAEEMAHDLQDLIDQVEGKSPAVDGFAGEGE